MVGLIQTLKLYRKWWRTWGTLPVRPWIHAAACYKSGHFKEAVDLYREGFTVAPAHPAAVCARLDLAYCCFRTGQFSEAEEALKTACELAPDEKEPYLRLAQFFTWVGRSLEAAWTLRRAIRRLGAEADLAAAFLNAAIDGNGSEVMAREALAAVKAAERKGQLSEKTQRKIAVARARYQLKFGNYERARTQLARLSCDGATSLEAIIAFSELLLEEGKIDFARLQLRRGFAAAPHHPRLASLLAETYLREGSFFNPEYAAQLATSACQLSNWKSPRELHVLAEAQLLRGDKMSALLTASRAKEVGTKVLTRYPKFKNLEALINDLQTGTLA